MATSTQVVTGKVRFSYAHVFEPYSNNGQDPKYSVTLLIPKTDKATLKKIKDAIEAAKKIFSDRNNGKPVPPNVKTTLHDGDGYTENGAEYGPECKGCYVINVSSNVRPVVIDAQKIPITDPTELYSGCYGRAIINFFVYNTAGRIGVSAGLNGIMKLYDGEPLAGNIITDADWDDGWEDDEADPLLG